MPIVDMSIEELKKYNGVNPRPVDHDEYWEKALAEMKAVEPQVTFTRASYESPIADCYDMYFTGVNGARIYAKHVRPKHITGKIPAVLMFHGYSGSSGDWYDKIGYAASGVAVFAMDVRGQGGRSEDVGGVYGNTLHGHVIRGLAEKDPQKLLYRDIFLDTAELASIVMDMDFVDETKVYVTGGSQGGALSLACASLEPRVSKIAVAEPFLCDFKRVWDMDLDVDVYKELRDYFRMFDPRHEHEKETFTKLGYIDIQYLVPRLKGEVLMLTGLLDTICPPSTQFAAYNKMTCKKRHLIYPDFNHEALKDVDDITYQFLINE